MSESQLRGLLEDFQDDALSETVCRECMEWFEEDDSRMKAFAYEQRLGNALAALHVMESDRRPDDTKRSAGFFQ